MIIKSIKLENFRNYESLELSFEKGTNILYGDNAQGKTNVLEAVYLSATTKSHKGSKDKEMIRFGQRFLWWCGRVRDPGRRKQIYPRI
mgnify:CR=1 FL=1